MAFSRSMPVQTRRSRTIPVVVASVILVAVAVATVLWLRPGSARRDKAVDTVPMIAVLPFQNLGSPDDEYFADGMTEEITSRLARIRGLGVISRTSAMKYKFTEKNLTEIGTELGVEYILEGSVRWSKLGDRSKVRITPQLVRVSDDRHLWADNYEKDLMEVFAVQAEIASRIVDQLGLTLLEGEREDLAARPTENERAYEYYLKGINAIREYNVSDIKNVPMRLETRANLDSAVHLDPSFAQAHAMRSMVYSMTAFGSKSPELAEIAREAAERSLELNPGMPLGRQALGVYYNLVETDYERALKEFNAARSETHNGADLISAIALVQLRQGRFFESQENFRKAVELDPINSNRHWQLGIALMFTRSHSESERSLNRAIALEPNRAQFHEQKLILSVHRYADWEPVSQVIEDALLKTDTLEFLSSAWWVCERLDDLPREAMFERFRTQYRDRMEIDSYYASAINEYPDDAFRASDLGEVLAALGECEEAVEMGQRGKEMLSIDDCHW
jgi:TolB-like protein